MATLSPRLKLPAPALTDSADVPRDIAALRDVLDPSAGWVLSGTAGARPAADAVPDRTLYYATDTNVIWITIAAAWLNVVPADGVITSAKIADGTIVRGDTSFGALGAPMLGAGLMRWGNGPPISQLSNVLVNHGLPGTPAFVMLTWYGVGSPTGDFAPLNYDFPNATQIRVYSTAMPYSPNSFSWMAFL